MPGGRIQSLAERGRFSGRLPNSGFAQRPHEGIVSETDDGKNRLLLRGCPLTWEACCVCCRLRCRYRASSRSSWSRTGQRTSLASARPLQGEICQTSVVLFPLLIVSPGSLCLADAVWSAVCCRRAVVYRRHLTDSSRGKADSQIEVDDSVPILHLLNPLEV